MLIVLASSKQLNSQCALSINNVAVQIVGTPIPVDATHCTITANVQFDLSYNGGAVFVYFNSYLAADYDALAISNPLAFDCANSSTPARDAPNAGRLGTTITQPGKSFLDVGLDLSSAHGAVGVPVSTPVLTTYSQDPTVALNTPANSGGFTVTRTFISGQTDHFVIQNLQLTISNACSGPLSVKTDVWASNASGSKAKAQCYICGVTQFFNDPAIAGLHHCSYPLSYDLSISTVNPTPRTITYKTYIDVDYDGIINTAIDVLAATSAPITISSSNSPYLATGLTYEPSSSNPIYFDKDLIIRVEGTSLSNSIDKIIPNGQCATLPIQLKSFTATRNQSNVSLKWETATEDNNSGFAVQRRLGSNGNWQNVGFVGSKAQNGNSTSPMNYEYTDINSEKGISLYRLKQIDIDNKAEFSVIRSVRGEEQSGKTIVYPNPSNDGRVNIVFEEVNVKRDLTLIDMNGRIIRQWKGETNNNIQIENLNAGFYSIRIVNTETGTQTLEKIVIIKH